MPFQKGHKVFGGQKTRFKKGHKIRVGMKHKPETIEKISKAKMGHPAYWKGKRIPEKARKKMSKARIGKYTGENSPSWRGGISFEPYPIDWVDTLKESIRKRDDYICQECGIHQDELNIGQVKKLDIHHIDYNKDNLDPESLISLCRKCHTKTNSNRKKWIKYFKQQ